MPMNIRALAMMFIIILSTGAAFAADANTEPREQSDDAAIQWATEQYEMVATEVFGSLAASDALPLETKWVVTVRISPAHDVDPEIQFALSKSAMRSGEVTAAVTRLRRPLQRQLEYLYRDYRELNASEIAKLIEVDRLAVSQAQCPAVARVAAAFERLRSPAAVENLLVVDPRQYHLWVNAGSQEVHFALVGASNGESRHPVIRWIESALDQLQNFCAPRVMSRKD